MKRKLNAEDDSSINDGTATADSDSLPALEQIPADHAGIHLFDVEDFIFGLFLRFIYQGRYALEFDGPQYWRDPMAPFVSPVSTDRMSNAQKEQGKSHTQNSTTRKHHTPGHSAFAADIFAQDNGTILSSRLPQGLAQVSGNGHSMPTHGHVQTKSKSTPNTGNASGANDNKCRFPSIHSSHASINTGDIYIQAYRMPGHSRTDVSPAFPHDYHHQRPLNLAPKDVPPSIRAWILGHRLRAAEFMNHAMEHIFHTLGVQFVLTPALVQYVWMNANTDNCGTTSPGMKGSLVAFRIHDQAQAYIPGSSQGPASVPFPPPTFLRELILDVMVVNWGLQNKIIAKSPALDVEWARLFHFHEDLRFHFILGLRNGRVVRPLSYYTLIYMARYGGLGRKDGDNSQNGGDMSKNGGSGQKGEGIGQNGYDMGQTGGGMGENGGSDSGENLTRQASAEPAIQPAPKRFKLDDDN